MRWPGMEKILLVTLPIVLVVGAINYFRPLPRPQFVYDLAAPASTQPVKVTWPLKAQAAIGAVGYGVLDATPTDQAMPTASVAKVMTALAVLKQKPLAIGQAGPFLKFTAADIKNYKKYVAEDGSVVPINLGQKMSEYQALQAMLIPSANNIADSLAVWAFGSMGAYISYANQLAKDLGMTATNINDASGFSPKTVSTAYDLVKLGLAASANPVIAKIVSQSTVNLPVAGAVLNTNWLLGQDGINGIKTGHTDQAGGCFLFSSRQKINGQTVTVIGAVMDAHDSAAAINASLPLIAKINQGFESVVVAKKDQVVAHYHTAWSVDVPVVAKQNLTILNWRGKSVAVSKQSVDLKVPAKAGATAGQLKASVESPTSSTELILQKEAPSPPWTWRLLRL